MFRSWVLTGQGAIELKSVSDDHVSRYKRSLFGDILQLLGFHVITVVTG